MWKKVKITLAERPSSCNGCQYQENGVCGLTRHSTRQVERGVSKYCPIKKKQGEVYIYLYVQEDIGICSRCCLEKNI